MKTMTVVVGAVLLAVLGLGGSAEAREPAKQKAEPAAPSETITLKPGEVKDLSIPGLTRLSVGDPDIADVEMAESDGLVVRLKGGKPGQTTLLVWTGEARRAFTIHVRR